MENKYYRLLEPLKIRGLMFPNRIFYSSCGHSPTHKHPSSWDSTYDNGLIFYDKSLGYGLFQNKQPFKQNCLRTQTFC